MENATRLRGRPAHKPDAIKRRFVETLAGVAVSQADIAAVLAVTVPTLRKHYGAELRRGASRLEAALALRLFQIAGGNDDVALKAIRFALQCKFGWSPYLPPPPR